MRLRLLTLSLVLSALLLAGPAVGSAAAGELLVSAAASLTSALSAVKQKYEAAHPGTRLILNFSSAGALIRQMENGAPVDVFCAADQQFMDDAAKKGLIDPATRRDFARNVMVLAVPADSRLAIAGLRDLAGPAVKRIALGNLTTTPLGREGKKAFEAIGVWGQVEQKLVMGETVRQVLDYIVRGEVDAGFIFATDAMHAGMKARVVFTLDDAGPFRFPAAVAKSSKNPAARDFVAYLAGPEGQGVLRTFGFLKP
jgi:molybdate transport system substrate-binding protein